MSDDDLDLEPMNKGRNRPIVIGLVVVGLAAAGAYLVQTRVKGGQESDARERTATAWNELRRCLVGDALLAHGRASAIVRRIEVGLPRPIEDTAPDERLGQWPFRCATHASVMTHALYDMHTDDGNFRLLAALVSRAASSLDEGQLRTGAHDRLTWIDELFAMIGLVSLPAGAPPHGPLPPAPATVLSPHEMTPVFVVQGSEAYVSSDPFPARSLRLVLGNARRSLCTFPAGATDDAQLTAVRCRALPFANAPATVRVLASDDDAPPLLRVGEDVFDGERRERVILGDAGSLVTENLWGAVGPVLHDVSAGTRGRAHSTAGSWQLDAVMPGGIVTRSDLVGMAAPAIGTPRVFDGVVVAVTAESSSDGGVAAADAAPDAAADGSVAARPDGSADGGDGGSAEPHAAQLWAANLPATLPPTLTLATVGTVTEGAMGPDFAGCRTGDTLALATFGANDAVSVAFHSGAGWSAPVPGMAPRRASLTCREHEATFTWIETTPHRWIHQLRCTAASCAEAHGSFPTFRGDVLPVATDVDGKVLLLVSPGPAHGLTMVLAPLAEIGSADRHVIFDDADHDGLDVAAPQVFVRAGTAAVVIATSAEPFLTYLIRIDRAGNFAPIRHDGME